MKNLCAITACSFLLLGCSSFPTRDLSQKELSIADCPSSPNCVSSQSTSPSHRIEPLKFRGSTDDFKKFVSKIAKDLPRTEIVRTEGSYVHLVVTSLIFRFKDDVELYFLESESLIHLRSASRVGYSDVGANRNRKDKIQKILNQFQAPKKSLIVIGHRGASGYRPEHTLEAYRLAIEMGVDFIEPDLVSTKDGILIARHENEISETTDAAQKFPRKKVTKIIDGEPKTGWFTEDFTLAEIKTLRAKERLDVRDQKYNGQFEIPTFDEVLALVKAESLKRSKSIGVYPETKHPSYFQNLGLPLDKKLVASLVSAKLDPQSNPVFIQSFEPSILKSLKAQTSYPLILLIGDLSQKPFDSKSMTYRQLLSDESLMDLKNTIVGIGFHKSHAMDPDLIERVQEQNLLIHVYTFRSDKTYLDSKYQGRPELEYFEFYKLGVDGVFSDFPDDAIKARAEFLNL